MHIINYVTMLPLLFIKISYEPFYLNFDPKQSAYTCMLASLLDFSR